MATIAKELPLQADRLEQFAGEVMEDIGGALALLLAFMGDQTGIYRSLRDDGPATPVELARRCGVDERYLREWLSAQAAAGYVDYHPVGKTFSLAPEKATVLMAGAFPNSTFHGFDFHPPFIEQARQRAAASGVSGNTRFEAKAAKEIPAASYDLVCMFDALHDMGDPVGAARHIRECMAADGTLMLVEPLAGDDLTENLNLVGQIFYAASTLVCTPASKAQEVGLALGAQAGQARLEEVLREAGFTRIRRATETDTNMVLEARP